MRPRLRRSGYPVIRAKELAKISYKVATASELLTMTGHNSMTSLSSSLKRAKKKNRVKPGILREAARLARSETMAKKGVRPRRPHMSAKTLAKYSHRARGAQELLSITGHRSMASLAHSLYMASRRGQNVNPEIRKEARKLTAQAYRNTHGRRRKSPTTQEQLARLSHQVLDAQQLLQLTGHKNMRVLSGALDIASRGGHHVDQDIRREVKKLKNEKVRLMIGSKGKLRIPGEELARLSWQVHSAKQLLVAGDYKNMRSLERTLFRASKKHKVNTEILHDVYSKAKRESELAVKAKGRAK